MNATDSTDLTFADLYRTIQIQRAKRDGCEVGFFRCEGCGQLRRWDDEPDGCDDKRKAREEREERAMQLRSAYDSAPSALEFCRIGNPTWEALRISPNARAIAAEWRRAHGSLLLLGPTGVGKTVSMVALLHRILDTARDFDLGLSSLVWASRSRFLSFVDICAYQKRQPFGAESAQLSLAKSATILVLDEVGFEGDSGPSLLLEIVDHRYKKGFHTLVTSGLTESEFRTQYGAAVTRKLTDRGTLLDLWGNSK